METALSICIGIGLSAACGFRVFIPLLIVSLAARSGHLTLAQGFAWIGSDYALLTFAVATVLEVVAYYVPWLDNLLDSLATPAAIVAGTIVTASLVGNMDPYLKWTLAVIAGGGAAGLVQATTVVARGASTLTSGGLANPIIATAELGGSLFMSIISMLAPVLAVLILIGGVAFVIWKFVLKRRNTAGNAPAP